MPRSLTSDPRGRFIALGRAYGEYLLDYAQELTADPIVAGQAAEKALIAATAHFEHADFGQVRADQARAERVRARRADLAQIGSWSEQAQVWTDQARADADPAGQSATGRRAENIRPWLYAAVRRECVARVQAAGGSVGAGRPGPAGRHAAELANDGSGGAGRSAGSGPWAEEAVADAMTAEFEITELQAEELRVQVSAVTQVLDGLPEQAREILGLAIRHGLGDDDIAVAMGMSRRRAGQERAEASARFDRLAATVLLLHAGWSGCERLDKMLGGSYPTAQPPSDKLCVKVTKHSESCMICGRIVASRGFGPELLSVLAIGRMPRPFRQQLSRAARELGRAPGRAHATPSRDEARRQAPADRAVPPAAGTAAAATDNGSATGGSAVSGSAANGSAGGAGHGGTANSSAGRDGTANSSAGRDGTANGSGGQGGSSNGSADPDGAADGGAGQRGAGSTGRGGPADGRRDRGSADRGSAGTGSAGRGSPGGAAEVSAAAAAAAGSAAGVAAAAAAGATQDRQARTGSSGPAGSGPAGSGPADSGWPGPGQSGPGQPHSGQPHSGQPGPGQAGPGQSGRGQPQPGQPRPGQAGPGQRGSEERRFWQRGVQRRVFPQPGIGQRPARWR